MDFNVVICAAAGTDDFSFVARKHRCRMEHEEGKKVGLAECLRNKSRRHMHGSVEFLSPVEQGMSKFGRGPRDAGRS